MKFHIYDLEAYPNFFYYCGKFEDDPQFHEFEISERVNHRTELLNFLSYLQNLEVHMVGFNNNGYDYPIIHELLNNPYKFDFRMAYLKSREIFDKTKFGFSSIRMSDRALPQIDLLKINHFDNGSKKTSLKALQFAMRSASVEDLPYDPTQDATFEQMDGLRSYGRHDVTETECFFKKCKNLIEMRQELIDGGNLKGDVLNYSDVKIGEQYLIQKIGRGKCYSGSKAKVSIRHEVHLKNVILPKLFFRNADCEAVHNWFKEQIVYIGIKGVKELKLKTRIGGMNCDFGLGGIHASVTKKVYETNNTHKIIDVDVTGMYVSLAIANGFGPEHLGQDFLTAYKQIKADRAQYEKGTSMNALLKLAGNGVFGKANSIYSPFYDPKYLYSVTINGQLQLLQLLEVLAMIPGIEMIQANTDGITAYVPRDVEHLFKLWCDDWEGLTGLNLEHVEYKKMWIRDVNNYMSVDMKDKIKRKGAYWYPEKEKDYEGWWNKDFSMLAVQKGITALHVQGLSAESAVMLQTDPFDFMLRYTTQGSAKLYIGDKQMLKTTRYYVSTAGEPMKKIAQPKGKIGDYKRKSKLTDAYFDEVLSQTPPGTWNENIHTKNKTKYALTETSIQSNRLIKQCNKASDFNWADVDYDFYIKEVEKLIVGG